MKVTKFIYSLRKHFPLQRIQHLFFALLLIGIILTGLISGIILVTFHQLKDIKPLETYSQYSVPTKIFDIHGKLITEFFQEKREIVPFQDLPDSLINAIVATEDRSFFKHRGFNLMAIIKGAFIEPILGKSQRGGSTLTQQLAKILFTGQQHSITRKLIELWYAIQIETKYSKQEILELYFNLHYFGHGCYGIQSASKYFFKKNANDLNVAEASFLAGLLQAPSRYSPIYHPYLAQKRHRIVLYSMVKAGYLTSEEAERYFDNFWGNYSTSFKAQGISASRGKANPAPYFTAYIRKKLLKKYGKEKLYSGGLQIYTTLDLDKQLVAHRVMTNAIAQEQKHYDLSVKENTQRFRRKFEDIVDLLSLSFGLDKIKVGEYRVRNKLEKTISKYDYPLYLVSFLLGQDQLNRQLKSRFILSKLVKEKKDQVEGALISINPTNGYIEAMVGGKDFNYANQYNRATLAKRPPGSSFKPLYYSLALDRKIVTPATLFEDAPLVYQDAAGNLWSPRNYSGHYRGPVRVRIGLQYSINVIAVQIWDLLLKKIGYTQVAEGISKFTGISVEEAKNRIKPLLAYALGIGVFTPIEVARAWTTFANQGVPQDPIAILKVKDRYGRVIDDFGLKKSQELDEKRRVISKKTAFIMQTILADVLYKGTGHYASKLTGFDLPAGGKTGTTSNWSDAWFAGFTRDMVTVVWFGFDDARKSLGIHRSAAVVAAPPWMRYMEEVHKGKTVQPFVKPRGVIETEICSESGLIPTAFCPDPIKEYFLPGTVPIKSCNIHTSKQELTPDAVNINSLSNLNIDLNQNTDTVNPESDLNNQESDTNNNEDQLNDVNLNLDNMDLNLSDGLD